MAAHDDGMIAVHGRNMDLRAAVQTAEDRYIGNNPESSRLAKLAAGHMPGGNTRTTIHFSPFPLYLAGGAGSRLTDVDGHRYADFINEYTAGIYGHSNPVIAETLRDTLSRGINLGGCTPHEIALAGEVRRRFPAMEQLRFCNSGTEANLLALATARAFTGRSAVMVFDGGYHGSMLYFANGISPINMQFDWIVSQYNDLDRAVADIAANASRLAAVMVEPLQGSSGAIASQPGFIAGLRKACDAHNLLLVLDEVMTSRLGFGGLQGKLGVKPDLTTLGKYVGGGITFGAFGGRADIMSRFDPSQPGAFPHGGTFNNNVLAMAAGYAGLTQVLTEPRLTAMNDLGDRLRQKLAEIAKQSDLPVQITGEGSIIGIHFGRRPVHRVADQRPAAKDQEAAIADLKKLFHLEMLTHSIYVARRIMGDLSIETTEAEVDAFCAAFADFASTYGGLVRQTVT
jgi:glutamate-1-semialdehyde 2,1-aminomutase